VAITSLSALIFSSIMPDSKTYTTSDIDLQNIQMILTPVNLDEETTTVILDSEYSLLNLHGAPPLIQLPQGDDVVLETWDVEHICDHYYK
jgi:hypothetical protein